MDVYENTLDISVVELLHTLAFSQNEYEPGIVTKLEQSLRTKGYGSRQIQSWREQFLSVDSAKANCQKCYESLILEFEDLISGSFPCPYCQYTQQINYNALDLKPYHPKLLKHLAEMNSANVSVDSNEAVTDEELLKALATNKYRNPKQLDYFKCIFVLRKFANEDLKIWRQKNIDADLIEERCQKCGRRSRPFHDELIAGEYSCPHCKQTQLIEYRKPVVRQTRLKPNYPEKIIKKSLSLSDLEEYSDTEILEALAMQNNEYTAESLKFLERLLVLRGFSINDLQAWRDGNTLSTEDQTQENKKFKPGGLLTKNLYGFYALLFGACFIDFLFSIGTFGNLDLRNPNPIWIMAVFIIFLAFVNIPLLFLQWFYRVYKNLEYLGKQRTKYHPSFAFGGFFIPIVMFFMPYFIAREIIQSCLLNGDRLQLNEKDNPFTNVKTWWASYLLMLLIEHLLLHLYGNTFLNEIGWQRAIADIAYIIAAVFAIQLIRIIDKLQNIKYQTIINR